MTGVSAALLRRYDLFAGAGTYTTTGPSSPSLVYRLLTATPGIYTLTGEDASLLYHSNGIVYTIDLEPGAYALTGMVLSPLPAEECKQLLALTFSRALLQYYAEPIVSLQRRAPTHGRVRMREPYAMRS